MINFDNSATTYPKPPAVRKAVDEAITRYGGNPGRSGHKLSLAVAEQVFSVREKAAAMFSAQIENVAFTANCTFATNMAIKGIMQHGGHIIISSMEHNAVSRPVHAMSDIYGTKYSIAEISADDYQTIENFRQLITKETRCIACTTASNVTGKIIPYRKLAQLCRENNLVFIGDCAQACGILDISLDDGFDFICTSGHKGLYGPTGTGLLITNGRYPLATIIEGGTGATSSQLEQTPFLPERLESGTINTVGILGLGKGLDFVKTKTTRQIFRHEDDLCKTFIDGIVSAKNVKIYRDDTPHVPIVAFNIGAVHSSEVSQYLSDRGYALRGGLQCAAVTHGYLGTTEQGVVRFSPSAFNTKQQTKALVAEIKSYANTI